MAIRTQTVVKHMPHRRRTLLRVLLAAVTTVVVCTAATERNDSSADAAAITTTRQAQIAQFLQQRDELSPLCLYTFDQPKQQQQHTRSLSSLSQTNSNTTNSNNSSAAHSPHLVFENHVPSVCPFGDLEADAALVQMLNTETDGFQLGVRLAADPTGNRKRVQLGSTDVVDARDMYAWAVTAIENKDTDKDTDDGDDDNKDKSKYSGGVTFELALRLHVPADSPVATSFPPPPPRGRSDVPATSISNATFADMTLFSIASVYDGCVDPGFRVDVERDGRLVLVYYLPATEIDGSTACYEQQLRSSNDETMFETLRTKCVLPAPVLSNTTANPVIYIAVTIDPGFRKGLYNSDFVVTYTHPLTLERIDCHVQDEWSPPPRTLLIGDSRLRGSLRLYLGNSPRFAHAPIPRSERAAKRTFRPLSSADMSRNATERLRAALLQKLMSIRGPKIPEAMRIFGDKSVSLTLFGVQLPPVNEDTPLAYLRGKLRNFLETNGVAIVDHLIHLLRMVQPVVEEPVLSISTSIMERVADMEEKEQNESNANATTNKDFRDATHASQFDLFHFAIYKVPLKWKRAAAGTFASLGPFRPLLATPLDQEIRMWEDGIATIHLPMLQSVYNDVQLELRAPLPERGQLLMFPNRTVVTLANMAQFRSLPPSQQQLLEFQSVADESNTNLPLVHAFEFSRRRDPYAIVHVGVYRSRTGRLVNTSAVARIRIFVAPVNDAPRPKHRVQRVAIEGVDRPIELDLRGDDVDGSPPPMPSLPSTTAANNTTNGDNATNGSATSDGSRDAVASLTTTLNPFDRSFNLAAVVKDKLTDVSNAALAAFKSFDFGLPTPPQPPLQVVKVTRLPQFGRLYDRRLVANVNATTNTTASTNETLALPLTLDRSRLERFRISLDDMKNKTFSTSLLYIPGAWSNDEDGAANDQLSVVDSTSGHVHAHRQLASASQQQQQRQCDATKDAAVVDELWYQLSDGDLNVLSAVAIVQFVNTSSCESLDNKNNNTNNTNNESTFIEIVQLQEDTSIALTLADMEPLLGLLDMRTTFQITRLPQHGALYQYRDATAATLHTTTAQTAAAKPRNITAANDTTTTFRMGKKIVRVGERVDDPHGRVVFVPDRDYYNVLPQEQANASTHATSSPFAIDSFAFAPENLTMVVTRITATQSAAVANTANATNTSSSALPVATLPTAATQPRVVGLQVLGEPDALVLLPPMRFVALAAQGVAVPVPVHFDDPDALYDGQYLAIVKAADGFSRFSLGANVSNDDVLQFCNVTRPCLLVRSLDANRTVSPVATGGQQAMQAKGVTGANANAVAVTNASYSNNSNNDNDDDWKLTFYIPNVILTPSSVSVLGNKRAVQRALAAMTYTDWSLNLFKARRSLFTVKIKRVNEKLHGAPGKSAAAAYAVDFPPTLSGDVSDMLTTIVRLAMTQAEELLWTFIMTLLVCVLITNPTCFANGSVCSCCCSSRARERRRHAFETERVRFEQQVAQNDVEYAQLLLDVADMLVAPDLTVATSLVLTMHRVDDMRGKRRCGIRKDRSSNSAAPTHHHAFLLTCVRSILPVLEIERQGTRLVCRLVVLEFEAAVLDAQMQPTAALERTFLGGSSCAGRVLALFCRSIGRNWLECVLGVITDATDIQQQQQLCERSGDASGNDVVDTVLETMQHMVAAVPAEIVILCRACVKLFTSDEATVLRQQRDRRRDRSEDVRLVQLRAVHLVFFCHFVGPALRFGLDDRRNASSSSSGVRSSMERHQRLQQRLTTAACHLVMLTQRWEPEYQQQQQQSYPPTHDDAYVLVDELEERQATSEQSQLVQYEQLLHTIATSLAVQSSYDPSSVPSSSSSTDASSCNAADAYAAQGTELMGLCLMNVHSMLDTFLPQFELQHTELMAQPQRLCASSCDGDSSDIAASSLLTLLRTLLRALSFPSVDIFALAQQMESKQSMQWLCGNSSGWSAHAWFAFATEMQQRSKRRDLRRQRITSGESEQPDSEQSDRRRTAATSARVFGRSQSLLAVHIDDDLVEFEVAEMSAASERF